MRKDEARVVRATGTEPQNKDNYCNASKKESIGVFLAKCVMMP
jgi:hypothetical protein